MTHTHSRIWVYIIWAVKSRQPLLTKETGVVLFDYLIEKAKSNNIGFEKLNIQPEHIHGLIDLPTNKTLADFMHSIKGSSSHMLNTSFFKSKFSWQRGYGAYSVSASKFDSIANYILNQSEHHRKKTFEEEYNEWKMEYGIFDD